jgi:hypothetical protein
MSAPVLYAADEPGQVVECASVACDATGRRGFEGEPPAGWCRLTVDGIDKHACSLPCAIETIDRFAMATALPFVPRQRSER